jgi:hypothetical protein
VGIGARREKGRRGDSECAGETGRRVSFLAVSPLASGLQASRHRACEAQAVVGASLMSPVCVTIPGEPSPECLCLLCPATTREWKST